MAESYLAGELILLVSLIWFEQQLPDVCVWIPLLVMFKWYGKVMMGWGGGEGGSTSNHSSHLHFSG